MAGTREGGKKTAITNKKRYGDDWYSKIGAMGGKVENPNKGFAANPDRARLAGAKGGKISRKGGSWSDEELARRKAYAEAKYEREKAILAQIKDLEKDW